MDRYVSGLTILRSLVKGSKWVISDKEHLKMAVCDIKQKSVLKVILHLQQYSIAAPTQRRGFKKSRPGPFKLEVQQVDKN